MFMYDGTVRGAGVYIEGGNIHVPYFIVRSV